MEFNMIEALLQTVQSEGKLILNLRKEVVFRNSFVSDLSSKVGEDAFIQCVLDCTRTTCYLDDCEFRCDLVGEYSIVTVIRSGFPTVLVNAIHNHPVPKLDSGSTSCPGNTVTSSLEDTCSNNSEAVGICVFRLDTVGGTSVAIELDEVFSQLVGVDRATLIAHGIPAVGNNCHPDDRTISDIFAKDLIARRSRGIWPIRIFIDNEYLWRQYEITITGEPDNDQFVSMKVHIVDYTEQAALMGLVSTPGMKTLELPDGNTRHIPMVHHSLTTEYNSVTVPLVSPGDDSPASTRVSASSSSDSRGVADMGNIACFRRYLGMRLLHSTDKALSNCTDSVVQVPYTPLDMDALIEELALSLSIEDYAKFTKAVASKNPTLCTIALSGCMGLQSDWFDEGVTAPVIRMSSSSALQQSDMMSLSSKFLMAFAVILPDPIQSIALLRGIYKCGGVALQLGGTNLAQLWGIELVLSVLSVAIKMDAAYFKIRENYTWLAGLLGSVIESMDSHDGLILQSMYWISVQWGFLHVHIGQPGLAREIWQSALDDIQEYIEQFPNTGTGKKLQSILTFNISKNNY